MSLLQETRNQYATFSNTASCGDLNVKGTIVTPSVSTDVLTATSIVSTTLESASIVTDALQVTTAPVAGEVLTSDATGNASWQPVPVAPLPTLAYGYAVGQDTTTGLAGGYIDFDLVTVVNNAGFTSVPGAGGTTFVIATAGVYEYSFYVAADDAAATTVALELAITVNGGPPAPANTFRSGLGGADAYPMVCIGSGLITLAAADTVSLQNITNASITPINFTNAPAGGVAGANRTLMLKLIE